MTGGENQQTTRQIKGHALLHVNVVWDTSRVVKYLKIRYKITMLINQPTANRVDSLIKIDFIMAQKKKKKKKKNGR